MRVAVTTLIITIITVLLAPVARVQHMWFGVERHEDVDLEIDCFVFRADSNGHGSATGLSACATLFDNINHDNSAAYLVVTDDVASEVAWLEATALAVGVMSSIGNILLVIGYWLPKYGIAPRRLALQSHVLAAAAGVFALNSAIRFTRYIERPHDPNGMTNGYVGLGLYIIISVPVVMLAHGSRVKTE
jgi:hypothetical protein